jgi:hypothetical protein
VIIGAVGGGNGNGADSRLKDHTMPKLNDTQAILVSTAATRDDRSFYPLPDTVKSGARVTNAITGLVDKALAEERETSNTALIHRTDGDISYGVFATDAGFIAIGIGTETGEGGEPSAPAPKAPPAPRVTKASLLVDLLSRKGGATLDELIAATDWLPHTVRAALTGLRKKGNDISRTKTDGKTSYVISGGADRGQG